MSMELVRYEAAKRAVAEYKTVDDLKGFRNVAMAAEAYAIQANDYELENDAVIARVRAERRAGELMTLLKKTPGVRNDITSSKGIEQVSEYRETCDRAGVSKDQASQWQKLAAVPEEEFEAALKIPGTRPSASNIIKTEKTSPPRMSDDALWWWGILRQIRARGVMKNPMSELTEEWTEAMTNDAIGIISKLNQWTK